MKRSLSILISLALLTMIFAIPAAAGDETLRYVVAFQGNGIPRNVEKAVDEAGGKLIETFSEVGIGIAVSSNPNFASKLTKAKGVYEVGLERYLALPLPEFVEYENSSGPTPGDIYYELFQWDIRRVKADSAWDVTSGSHSTVVAVIDTGIAWNHPDLAPNVIYAECYSSSSVCSAYPDLHGHGTHVAGTIAAAFGGGAAVGVGPDLGLASYNVFELIPGFGVGAYDSSIWAAMIDAANQDFDVINMSLGSYILFPDKEAAVWTAWNRIADYVSKQGVTIVASSGNAGADLNGPWAHIPSDVTGIISVGGTGIRPDWVYPQEGFYDIRADYSNYGAQITLVAPGGECGPLGEDPPGYCIVPFWLVFSTYALPNPICAATESCPVLYAWGGGTSMSSPHVAGAAGLVMDMNPRLNPHQVTSILKRTAENLGDRQQFGHGMLDVFEAVNE